MDYGFENKTFNKYEPNIRYIRNDRGKNTCAAFCFCSDGKDTASEILKSTKFGEKIKKKSMTIRYDNRTFKFYPDSPTISLTTVQGRLVYPVAHSPYTCQI